MYVHVILFVWSKGVVDISGQVDADVGDLQDGLINVYQPVYQPCLCLWEERRERECKVV